MPPKKRSDAVKEAEATRLAIAEEIFALPLDERRARVRAEIAVEAKAFLQRRYDRVRKLTLKDMNLNPFLLRLIREIHGIETPSDVIDYCVGSTLAAGHETAYGWMVDLFIPPLFGASTPAEREDTHQWEVFKEIDKEATKPNPKSGSVERHFISVKAGPMTINDTMAREMHTNVKGFVEYGKGPVIYAVTYGRRDQLSNKPGIVKGSYPDDKVAILVGREYWAWLAGYDEAVEDMFNGIADGETAFAAEEGMSISAAVTKKKAELTEAFVKEYKIAAGDDMWQRLLETAF